MDSKKNTPNLKGVIFIDFSTLLDKKKKNSDRCSKLTRP